MSNQTKTTPREITVNTGASAPSQSSRMDALENTVGSLAQGMGQLLQMFQAQQQAQTMVQTAAGPVPSAKVQQVGNDNGSASGSLGKDGILTVTIKPGTTRPSSTGKSMVRATGRVNLPDGSRLQFNWIQPNK